MVIYVDADACPVKEIVVFAAKSHGVPLTMLCDTSHVINDGYSTVITVEKGADSVDFKLLSLVKPGDVVVTQDYGLAAMVLAKKAYCLDQNGMVFTDDNIQLLLAQRHTSAVARRRGKRGPRIPPRTPQANEAFRTQFTQLLLNIQKGKA